MLNIVMPLAGAGQRFKDAGYTDPKPLIKVDGQSMCELVRSNIVPARRDHRLIAISQYDVTGKLRRKNDEPFADRSIPVTFVTEGAACTVLLAEEYLDNYDPLLIVNGDQYIEGLDIDVFLDYASDFHGAVMTFDVGPDEPPKWSYVRRGHTAYQGNVPLRNRIIEVAEKNPISQEATCGIYWFRHGRDFLRAANAMITKDIRTNGEFYLCPVYNEMLAEGRKIGAWKVESMHGLGTPEDLEKFIAYRGHTERAGSDVG